ncbi:MAG: glyceraldehyde 3-phosphate dehydrogenase NAD-binding domain-containing protein, partial [Evtepia sp.]
MFPKIGINGFGRIGRLALRLAADREDVRFSAINSHSQTPDYMAYLLQYDSVHGNFRGKIRYDENNLIVNDRKIRVFHAENPNEIPWREADVNIVMESTGKFLTAEKMQGHLDAGARKVVLTAPAKDNTPMFVMGVNQETYNPSMHFVSNASCTTNCLAPLAKVLHDNFGIKEAL